MGRLFGTDGVRGLANRDVTAELALDLSVAAAHVLGARRRSRGTGPGRSSGVTPGRPGSSSRPRCRGARLGGRRRQQRRRAADARGGVPDRRLGVDIGVVLSASHNPMPDNGIKFLSRGGHKLDDELEAAIEARMGEDWERPLGGDVGRDPGRHRAAGEQYIEHLVGTIDVPLDGLRIAVDCANGAASEVAPGGAAGRPAPTSSSSTPRPTGCNINEKCGSTHPEQLQAAVVASEADLGVAFDGDADRCLAVDAAGALVDGDQIMGILAIAMRERGDLVADTLVTTVMSNLGLKIAMTQAGIATVETAVGDRYVLEAMRAGGYSLGGEQSGHIIMRDHATTGDGVLTALQLAARVAATGTALADLAGVVRRLPQTLVNVPGVDKRRARRRTSRCRRRARGGVRARQHRAGAPALVGHRGAGPGHGRGGHAGGGDRVAHELADVVARNVSL